VENPQGYQLIFGTPLPGYHAPPERTMPAAARSLSVLIGVLEQAWLAGALNPASLPPLSPGLLAQFEAWRALQPVSNAGVLYLALVIWGRVHGLVMIEIGGQCPPYIQSMDEVFQAEVQALAAGLIRLAPAG
jgi:hypothetical protein